MAEQPTTVTGQRHHDDCRCGCQWVVGLSGRLVENSDTPKLATMGMGIYAFTRPPDDREVTVAYDLAEVGGG